MSLLQYSFRSNPTQPTGYEGMVDGWSELKSTVQGSGQKQRLGYSTSVYRLLLTCDARDQALLEILPINPFPSKERPCSTPLPLPPRNLDSISFQTLCCCGCTKECGAKYQKCIGYYVLPPLEKILWGRPCCLMSREHRINHTGPRLHFLSADRRT